MTDKAKAKAIGRELVEAAEDYLIEFIRAVVRDDATLTALGPKRDRLFEAIDAAIDAANED